MADFLLVAAGLLLLSVAAGWAGILRGPEPADRMMGAQLAGTGGVGALVLLTAAMEEPAILDVALVLALLAALAAVGFVKALSPDGAGDPEEEEDAP